MKKILFMALGALILSSCVKDSEEYKQLQAERDSLAAITESQNDELNSYFKTLNEISDNFDMIARTESLVSAEANQENIHDDASLRIKSNLQLMTDALQKNREKIALLEQQVKKNGRINTELQQTIQRLMADVDAKTLALDSLVTVLANKDRRIFELDGEVGRLTDENVKKSNIISEQSDLLSSAWYVFGTKKELKTQNIITKKGWFSSTKVLQKDFNQDYFVKIDIRNTTSIPVYSKKAKILTSHPENSYELKDENGTKVLVIKNPTEFWSISKYLVIQTN